MDRQQVMFAETQGQVPDHLKAGLMGTYDDWQILFMTYAATALDLIPQRNEGIVLANPGMDTPDCEDFFSVLKNIAPQVIRTGLPVKILLA